MLDVELGTWMGLKDLIAVLAVIISLFALVVSLINRRADIDRLNKYRTRDKVWNLLTSSAGLRSIEALAKEDGKTEKRVEMLRRTATQLKTAGAKSLGDELESLLHNTWPSGKGTTAAKEEFLDSVNDYMKV